MTAYTYRPGRPGQVVFGALGFLVLLASAPALAQSTPASEQPCSRLWGADRPCRQEYPPPFPDTAAAQKRPWEKPTR
jgi:hypothetical protein